MILLIITALVGRRAIGRRPLMVASIWRRTVILAFAVRWRPLVVMILAVIVPVRRITLLIMMVVMPIGLLIPVGMLVAVVLIALLWMAIAITVIRMIGRM